MSTMIVVGGGIGGLAAALAAADCGHAVVVLERNDAFQELGAGIQIAPNGMYALEHLGLARRVREIAVHIDRLRFMDGVTGAHVASMPLTDEYVQRFGNEYVVVHRGELHRLLVQACQRSNNIDLRGGVCVTGYHQGPDGVLVELRDGTGVAGDALIGADGIRSAVRAQLLGDGEPQVAGITVFRSVIPMERVPEELRTNSVTWWAGPGCHFVHYPIAGGEYLNLAPSSENGASTAFSCVPVTAAEVRSELGALGDSAHRILELGDGWRSWSLIDREPVDVWTDERVVLLGDAAHPMLHYLAQGACQALEDAVVLGDWLSYTGGDIAPSFEKYNAARRDRTAAMQKLARESVRLWHPVGPAAEARNASLSAMSTTDMFDQIAWMHGDRDFGAAGPAG